TVAHIRNHASLAITAAKAYPRISWPRSRAAHVQGATRARDAWSRAGHPGRLRCAGRPGGGRFFQTVRIRAQRRMDVCLQADRGWDGHLPEGDPEGRVPGGLVP